MDKASEQARQGNLAYFESLNSEQLIELVVKKDEDGRSLLHSAAVSGNLELLQLLASLGRGKTMVDVPDDEGWTPLHCAVSSGHEAAASFLLAAAAGAAQVDATTTSGRTPLHYAASKGKPALVKMLLSAGAAVGVRDETGSSPLHRGASAGKLEAVKVLVEEGRAQVDAVDGQGCSPLHVAAGCDHAHVALFLLSRGANPRLEAKDKTTPLDVASEALREALLREMPDGGARDDGMEA